MVASPVPQLGPELSTTEETPMALIHRMTRLFQADMHAVLDRIEEPEQTLRQAIRDMEEELDAGEQRIRQRAAEQQLLLTRQAAINALLTETEQELDLCFQAHKDDLARGLVRKKLEAQSLLKRLRSMETANTEWLREQQTRLQEHRSTLEGLRQKAEILSLRPSPERRGKAGEPAWDLCEVTVSESDIEVAYLRELHLREHNARRPS